MASFAIKNGLTTGPEHETRGLLVHAARELGSLHSELPRALRAYAKGGDDGLREFCFRYGQRLGELLIPKDDGLKQLGHELDLWERVSREAECGRRDELQGQTGELKSEIQSEHERLLA